MSGKIDNWLNSRKARRESLSPELLLTGILDGKKEVLSKAVTLIESNKQEDRLLANKLIELCLPHSGSSIRIGITGVPGVGKSTFIESFGQILLGLGKKVAVLAIDPSSSISGGSILGDKTRMNELSIQENVFIRPSASGSTLGGVGRNTRESILLCEAAGYDVILIETVGVGQSETTVKSMVDFFLLLMLSGAGDELQGIKKGIMEMADAIVVTKSDGENIKRSKLAASDYRNAIHLFPANENGWTVPVFTCSSITGENIPKVWDEIFSFYNSMTIKGWIDSNRKEQDKKWLKDTLENLILSGFYDSPNLLQELKVIQQKIDKESISFFAAAQNLYAIYLKSIKNDRV